MKMKSAILLCFFLLLILDSTFAQQFYYSNNEKIVLSEDTSTLIFKVDVKANSSSILKKIPSNLFEEYDTVNAVGIIEAKIKKGANRLSVLRQLRKDKSIIYSWHLLKSKKSILLPTGEIILSTFKGTSIEEILIKLKINDDVKVKKIDEYGFVTLTVINEDKTFFYANYLYESKLVKWCHPNFWAEVKHNTIDPLYSNQWYMKNTGQYFGASGIDINIEGAWALTQGNSNIRIAVIDDGVENHEDISGRVVSGYTPRNAAGLGAPNSSGRHGQACAGIIAATKDNNIGIAGIAPNCLIVPVNIFHGGETATDIASAINWAWNHGQADVISNSWSILPADAIINAINSARTKGRGGKGSVVVFSSANDFSAVAFPANVNGVITVGAINNNGNLHSYSNTGPSMDLVAPSGSINLGPLALNNPIDGIRTTDRMGTNGYGPDNYVSFNGTSAACPQVSGVAALVLSVNPNLTESQVTSILNSTATDMGTAGFDNTFGYGRLNACAAVYKALGTTLSISGPYEICGSATYTIPNLPAGSVVNWSVAPAGVLSYTASGNTATFTKVGYAESAVITASITTPCGNVTTSTYVNPGNYLVIYDRGPICPNTGGNIFSSNQTLTANYLWKLRRTDGSTPRYMMLGERSPRIDLFVYETGTFILSFSLTNSCGVSQTQIPITVVDYGCIGGYPYMVYPNPSSNELKISQKLVEDVGSAKKMGSNIFSVKLLNEKGKILKAGKVNANSREIVLQVADIPNGIYYLHIYEGKNVKKQQVVISH